MVLGRIMLRRALFLLGVLAATVTCAADQLRPITSHSPSEQKDRTVNALMKAVSYMRGNYDKLNLDAITGLRIIQGELHSLSENGDEGVKLLTESVLETIALGLPAVKAYQPEYYQQLSRLVEPDFWERELPGSTRKEEDNFMRKIVERLVLQSERRDGGTDGSDNKHPDELFDEKLSDHCIQEIINHRCNISLSCISMMTAEGVQGYTATHQVYYFIIMIQAGCLSDTTETIVRQITNSLCANIYIQALSEAKKHDIERDLFMEQVGLCGLAGYYNLFSRHDWVDDILSWQRDEGCYGNVEDFLSELEQIEETSRFRRSPPSVSHPDSAVRRVRREERIMDDGCLSHRTTVASIALMQNYKSLLEVLATEHHSLRPRPTQDDTPQSTQGYDSQRSLGQLERTKQQNMEEKLLQSLS